MHEAENHFSCWKKLSIMLRIKITTYRGRQSSYYIKEKQASSSTFLGMSNAKSTPNYGTRSCFLPVTWRTRSILCMSSECSFHQLSINKFWRLQSVPHFLTTLSLADVLAGYIVLSNSSLGSLPEPDRTVCLESLDETKANQFLVPRNTNSNEFETMANITLPFASKRYCYKDDIELVQLRQFRALLKRSENEVNSYQGNDANNGNDCLLSLFPEMVSAEPAKPSSTSKPASASRGTSTASLLPLLNFFIPFLELSFLFSESTV